MAEQLQHDVGKNKRGQLQIDAIITLVDTGETKEEDTKTDVMATVDPIGRDEFIAAGQKDMKAKYKFVLWENEYQEESEVIYKNRRLSVYRTYGPRPDGKVELYAGERVGNTWT